MKRQACRNRLLNPIVLTKVNLQLYFLDETTGDGGLGIGSLVTFSDPRQDPYLSVPDGKNDENFDLESNSDLEDIKIKPTDNLVLVGHVEGNASILEVYGMLTGF